MIVDAQYHLADDFDLEECRELQEQQGFPDLLIGRPTVVAYRGGKLLGFLATDLSKGVIAAGPLVLAEGFHPVVALRLVEAYEVVLKKAGVSSYMFWVDKARDRWLSSVEKISQKVRETDSMVLFMRSVA